MISEKHRFGHLRCRETKKPSVFAPSVHIMRCSVCGNIIFAMGENCGNMDCCSMPMEVMELHSAEEFQGEIQLSYLIFGSLNENAIKAVWECKNPLEKPVWIWLRTFSGGQLKYLKSGKRSPVIFGLADEDAYAYCDKDPCVECTFRCKRGFGLYFYFEHRGIIYVPLERMCARQQTKNHGVSLDTILQREKEQKEME